MRFLFLILTCASISAGSFTAWPFNIEGWPFCVPHPPLSPTNSHWMYHPDFEGGHTYNYGDGAGAVPYKTNLYGPYTHYVDNTAVGATDTPQPGEPNPRLGTPLLPRLTWHTNSPPGSVVQIRGGPYTFGNGPSGSMLAGGAGTADAIIFFVAVPLTPGSTNWNDHPQISRGNQGSLELFGSYVACMGLQFVGGSALQSRPGRLGIINGPFLSTTNKFVGTGVRGGNNAMGALTTGASATAYTHDWTIMYNEFSDYGNWQNATESDQLAMIAGEWSFGIWMGRNSIKRMGGDGIRFGKNDSGYASGPDCDNGFFFENWCEDLGENPWDTKQAGTVVAYGNKGRNFCNITSAGGQITSTHYWPRGPLFYINNDFDAGIGNAGSGFYFSESEGDVYIVGNIIRNIAMSNRRAFQNGGGNANGGVFTIAHNTFADCGTGYHFGDTVSPGTLTYQFRGNMIYNMATRYAVVTSSGSPAATTVNRDNWYHPAGADVPSQWGGTTYTTAVALDAAQANVTNLRSRDPLFVDPGSDNFRLQEGSPNIDDGDSSWIAAFVVDYEAAFGVSLNGPWVDLDGNERTGEWDSGAHEFSAEAATVTRTVYRGATISGATIR